MFARLFVMPTHRQALLVLALAILLLTTIAVAAGSGAEATPLVADGPHEGYWWGT